MKLKQHPPRRWTIALVRSQSGYLIQAKQIHGIGSQLNQEQDRKDRNQAASETCCGVGTLDSCAVGILKSRDLVALGELSSGTKLAKSLWSLGGLELWRGSGPHPSS